MEKVKPLISVILPFYNNVRQLPKAVESVMKQSFINFELLLIDDGSTDGSFNKVAEMIRGDERCKLFHQENQGVSAARNCGLKEAKGDYLCFVDADDYVGPDYLKHLFEKVECSSGIGLIISGAYQVREDGTFLSNISLPEMVIDKTDFLKLFTETHIEKFGYPWGKIYNLNLVRSLELQFPPISNREDLIFMFQYLLHCDFVFILSWQDYYYVRATNSSNSLSVKIASFESEFIGYDMYVSCIEAFSLQYGFSLKDVENVMNSIMITFQRAIKSDYQPRTRVVLKKRIEHLRRIVELHRRYLVLYYHPDYLIDKFCRILLLQGFYHFYDWIVRLIFFLGIKNKMFFGPQ